MAQTVHDALREATLYSDEYVYRFVQLPPNAIVAAAGVVAETATPFSALLLDKDEVTLMLEEEDFEQFKHRLLDHRVSDIGYRLITFDVELEPTLIGFMAQVSAALADANISLLPFAAYSRDHIFVAEDQFEQAIQVLEELKTKTK